MLTDKSIHYIIRQIKKCKGTKIVAEELNISQRHVRWLWVEYVKTGTVHTRGNVGRPKKPKPSDAEFEMALNTHRHWPDVVQMTVRRLRRAGCNMSYVRVYDILKPHG